MNFFVIILLWQHILYLCTLFLVQGGKWTGYRGVVGILLWHNPSGRTMALGSTQPLTETSTRCISWGKGGRCVRLTTLPPSCAVVMKSGNLNFLEPSGPLQACNGTALSLTYSLLLETESTPETYCDQKNSSDTIGNRTHDLLVCGVVP